MKRAVMTGPAAIEIQDIGIPDYAEDEVLVQIKSVGICTWEQGFYTGAKKQFPFVGGHEICGVVEKVGSRVAQKIEPGDRVVVASLTRCGECDNCRRGLDNLCENAVESVRPGELWGPGGFSEFRAFRGYEVFRISPEVPFPVGTLAEPLACVIRSIDRARLRHGDTVLVQGGGVMGILHVLLALRQGARVIVSEPDPARRQKAMEFGAFMAADPLADDFRDRVFQVTNGHGADAVFFTAGGTEAFDQGLTLLRSNGTMVVYGAIKPSEATPIDPMVFHYDEIILTGVSKHTKDTFRRAAELVSWGELPLDRLITQTMPFQDIEAAFQRSLSSETYRVVLVME